MATTRGDRVFCDTNVLLCAIDRSRPHHDRALRVLNDWPASGIDLHVSGQVLRELLAVSTRPPEVNGLGLDRRRAVQNARAIAARSTIVDEHRGVSQRLLKLLDVTDCRGKRVHDANIVATMLEHGLTKIVTDDQDGFAPFQATIAPLPLSNL